MKIIKPTLPTMIKLQHVSMLATTSRAQIDEKMIFRRRKRFQLVTRSVEVGMMKTQRMRRTF